MAILLPGIDRGPAFKLNLWFNNIGQQWDFANCCIQESDGMGQIIMIQAKDKSIIQELQEQQLSIKCFSRFCFIIKILKTSLILDK